MSPYRLRSPFRISLSWLVWLALLLPLAQSTATWHAFSHLAADAGAGNDRLARHATPCELCLAAAAVSGGGLPSAPPALSLATLRHQPPPAATHGVWLSPPTLAYLSRAPPFAPV